MTANEFKLLRARLGMTQVKLAQALDVSERHVSRFENGDATIPKTTVLAMQHLAVESPPHQEKRHEPN